MTDAKKTTTPDPISPEDEIAATLAAVAIENAAHFDEHIQQLEYVIKQMPRHIEAAYEGGDEELADYFLDKEGQLKHMLVDFTIEKDKALSPFPFLPDHPLNND